MSTSAIKLHLASNFTHKSSDSVTARTLTVVPGLTGANTIESCTSACFAAGYHLAGAEYSDECYCGNGFQNGGAPAALADCNMPCAGDASESCGGPDRLNVRKNVHCDLGCSTMLSVS